MSGDKPIRAFLAVEIPHHIKSGIRDIQKRLAPRIQDIRWVRPEGIHLTLKFFGNISEEDIPCISRIVEGKTANIIPITLRVHAIGVFPQPDRPRVLWMGLNGDTDRLSTLQSDIESALLECGCQRENRRFTPHLTLGRVKSQKKMFTETRDIMDERAKYGVGQFEARGLTLFKSELKPEGALYSKLAYYPFKV